VSETADPLTGDGSADSRSKDGIREQDLVAGLREQDLPAEYRAANARAVGAQRSYLWLVRAQLILLLAAGLLSVVSATVRDAAWTGAGVACVFVAVSVMRLAQRSLRIEATWYDARAVAESVKTLAWRFAVRAEPFGLADDSAQVNGTSTEDAAADTADRLFLERLQQITATAKQPFLGHDLNDEQVTDAMRELRGQSLKLRRDVYDRDRLRDQFRWYGTKARSNEQSRDRWDAAFLALSSLAVLSALFLATGVMSANVAGFASTVVAAVLTWVGVRGYAILARSYAVTAFELSLARALLKTVNTEDQWSRFVVDAEESISREHTMWRASRS
jgi:SMODS and SLOG-associating 2TM effector domain 1/SMODS and SLOG-associating 2TM effector domain 3